VAESVTGYHASSSSPVPVAVTAANVAGLWVGLLGAVLYCSRVRGSGKLSADFGWRIGAWWDLPLGAAVGLASQFLLIPAAYEPVRTVDRSVNHQLSQTVHRQTGAAHSSGAVTILLLFLALGAPVVEELFFRGLLLRSLLGRMPAAPAVVVSAVLFALAHFEVVQFVGLVLFGVVLALLAWRTRRLGPSIAAHVAFNAVAVISAVHLR
jgi:membrane protease YdiL (CAAX protease family)